MVATQVKDLFVVVSIVTPTRTMRRTLLNSEGMLNLIPKHRRNVKSDMVSVVVEAARSAVVITYENQISNVGLYVTANDEVLPVLRV